MDAATDGTTPARDLVAGDVFERHGRVWTVEHAVRGWYGSVHVLCVGGGQVWFPQAATVVVRGDG